MIWNEFLLGPILKLGLTRASISTFSIELCMDYQKKLGIPDPYDDNVKNLLLPPYYSNMTFQNQCGNQAKKNSSRHTELRLLVGLYYVNWGTEEKVGPFGIFNKASRYCTRIPYHKDEHQTHEAELGR